MNTEYIAKYTDFLKKRFDLKKPLTIVCDGSNGTTGLVLEHLKDVPNLTLHLINTDADGNFPAHGPNPLEKGATDELARTVVEMKADFGVAFDADGDRAFFVDETGRSLHSFMTSVLLFKTAPPPFVGDELVYQALKHVKLNNEADLKPSKIGSFYVKEVLKKEGASIGAEFSGHYYFKEFFGVDSGIFTMLVIANAVSVMDTKMSAFFASIPPHEMASGSVKTEGKVVADVLKKLEEAFAGKAEINHLDGITLDFGPSWISIRASNTEPIIKFIAGAPTEAEAQKLVDTIKALV